MPLGSNPSYKPNPVRNRNPCKPKGCGIYFTTGIETLVSRKVAVSISLPESKPTCFYKVKGCGTYSTDCDGDQPSARQCYKLKGCGILFALIDWVRTLQDTVIALSF